MEKRIIATLVLIATVAWVSAGQSRSVQNYVESPFVSGGEVRLKLSSGDYTIRAGNGDRIRVESLSRDPIDVDRAVRINVRGSSAVVRTDGPWRNARFVIELPRRSDIAVDVRAGDIKIGAIEGNKAIRMTAGDLEINVDPDSYSRIDAGTTFGDLAARPLRIFKGGIGRSFHWTGSGSYELRAHLFAGDLTLSEK